VEWTRQEKRTFLRHRVELRLASLYLETLDYTSALPLISACVPLSFSCCARAQP
jgi:26S proteasome regulatory subunit N6